MSIEFKNANSFREYPFREFTATDPTGPALFLAEAVVDAQFDVFCDRLRDKDDVAPLVVIDHAEFEVVENDHFTLNLDISVGFGLRDESTSLPTIDTATSRKWFQLSSVVLTTQLPTSDDTYTYLWVSQSAEEIDAEEDVYKGTPMYVTGYIAINTEFLAQATGFFTTDFVTHGVDGFGNTTTTLLDSTPILEEGAVVFTGMQLVRQIHIANLAPISAPGLEDSRDIRVVTDFSSGISKNPIAFQGDVKLEEGFNCRINTNRQTGKITIVPTLGAGQGEPCQENDPDVDEDACNDFIYSINNVASNGGGIQFKGIPPLQIFQGDPTFTSHSGPVANPDYIRGDNFPTGEIGSITEAEFWTHALVFRLGSWGDNDNNACSGNPDCPEEEL